MQPRERAERPRQTTRSVGRSPTEPGAKESNVRLRQSGGGEDVDHLAFGGDGLAHELADGGGDLLGCLPVAAALFVQRGLQGLEKGNVVADLRGFIARGAEGKGAGKLRHHLHPALLAAFQFEDVLLSGEDELQALGRSAAGPLLPVEAVHVPHDDDLEGGLGVLEPVRQLAPRILAADVLLPVGAAEIGNTKLLAQPGVVRTNESTQPAAGSASCFRESPAHRTIICPMRVPHERRNLVFLRGLRFSFACTRGAFDLDLDGQFAIHKK